MEAIAARRGLLVLCSASSLCLLLGSVHAFSVFLEPLEARFDAARSTVSLTYSFALVVLTVAVLTGHRVFSRVPAGWLVLGLCLTGALGALIAARATSLTGVWVGYSLLFGGANGFGYAFGLQSAASANPGREGIAMGVVTASYALGAAISPILFANAVKSGGFGAAMLGLALALIVVAPVSSWLMHQSDLVWRASQPAGQSNMPPKAPIALLWIGYGAGVAAGLMAIGHAAGIARSVGWHGASWTTPALIAVFNMMGSFAGGWLIDRLMPARLLLSLALVSATALGVLAASGHGAATLPALATVGFCYGAIIAVYPAMITKLYGAHFGTRIYGKVFTAWGAAGLLAPWFAGVLFDRTGGYSVALLTAAALSILSAIAAHLLSHHRDPAL